MEGERREEREKERVGKERGGGGSRVRSGRVLGRSKEREAQWKKIPEGKEDGQNVEDAK